MGAGGHPTASRRRGRSQEVGGEVSGFEARRGVLPLDMDGRRVRSGAGCGSGRASRDRVVLVFEANEYDVEYYCEQVIQAAESVLSPLGWRENEIRGYLADRADTGLSRY